MACGSDRYLLEVPDAVVAAEALLLAVHQQEVVSRGAVGQVVAALLAAVHDQPVGPAVHVETRVAADLVSHRLEAHLVTNLQRWVRRRRGEGERRAPSKQRQPTEKHFIEMKRFLDKKGKSSIITFL